MNDRVTPTNAALPTNDLAKRVSGAVAEESTRKVEGLGIVLFRACRRVLTSLTKKFLILDAVPEGC